LMTLVNGGRAQPMPVPGVVYRSLTPSPLLDFGLAYFRDDPSPIVANLLEIATRFAGEELRNHADGEPLWGALD
jgi:hypothetical protein